MSPPPGKSKSSLGDGVDTEERVREGVSMSKDEDEEPLSVVWKLSVLWKKCAPAP
jgi:hypothetical protein